MNKEELKLELARSPKTVVCIQRSTHTDMTIAVGEGVVADAIAEGKRALKNGLTVEWADGTKQWETTVEVIDSTKSGSAMFTWASGGEKILHHVFLCTLKKNGEFEREFVRKSWRNFE